MTRRRSRSRRTSSTAELPEELKPYEFHGLDVQWKEGKSQGQCNCPFCGDSKFFISAKTGQYSCKKCGAEGNKVTFLTEYHKMAFKLVTEADLKKINGMRGGVYTTEQLRDLQFCFNHVGDVLIPNKTPGKKNLSNLKKWNQKTGRAFNTPTCCSLGYVQWNDEGPVYICEGDWDGPALQRLMQRAKHDKPCSIVYVPGANTFKDSWAERFKGRDLVFIYDNDHDKVRKGSEETYNPARDGMESAIKKVGGIAKSVKVIDWDSVEKDLPDGYDLRDHLVKAVETKKSKKYLRNLLNSCDQVSGDGTKKKQIKVLRRTSFEQVVADWRSVYAFNQAFEDVLACCFATMISLFMGEREKPLWLFIVAPPSSGKTTIIEGFKEAREYTEYISELTPASLVTGLKFDEDFDPSLLARGNNKVWFIEDFTPILNLPKTMSMEIFGILRAAYNGFYDAHFAAMHRSYEDRHFSIVAGVTHAIERINLGDFGERFLRIRLLDTDFDEDEHIERALNNVNVSMRQKEKIFGAVNGFIEHLMNNKVEPTYNNVMNKKLRNLAKLTALLRTEVHRNKNEISTRAIPEVASRIATQLKKLGLYLAVVYGREEVCDECYRVMQKVAFDTSVGWSFELVQTLHNAGTGMTNKTLSDKMHLHINQIGKIAADALQLGIIEQRRVSNNSGNRGNKAKKYFLSEKVQKMLEDAEVTFDQKRKTYSTRANRSKRRSRATR